MKKESRTYLGISSFYLYNHSRVRQKLVRLFTYSNLGTCNRFVSCIARFNILNPNDLTISIRESFCDFGPDLVSDMQNPNHRIENSICYLRIQFPLVIPRKHSNYHPKNHQTPDDFPFSPFAFRKIFLK